VAEAECQPWLRWCMTMKKIILASLLTIAFGDHFDRRLG
jgi:hypothetical protein